MNTIKKPAISKKAQIWSVDFTIGLLLFIFILLGAIVLIRNLNNEDDKYSIVAREANHISTSLVSEGLPAGWTNYTVILPGITDNNRVNNTRLNEFDKIKYEKTKIMMQVTGEYVFYFYNGTIINETKCFRGYDFGNICTLSLPASAKNIAQTERLVILNSSIVKLIVVSWNTEV
jgi:hypothetical protein